jgi:SAM-dependent methyltransferase
MTKLKSTIKFNGIKYFNTVPDPMWFCEVEKLIPWLMGQGADIGCGQRSIYASIIRVDIDENNKPDVLSNGDDLPFADNELDYITSIHSLEHFEDQHKTLKEWLRVIKSGGIIAIIHPDVDFTKKQNPDINSLALKDNPYNRHYHENNLESLKSELETWKDLSFQIIDCGVACPNWSFYLIIQKI